MTAKDRVRAIELAARFALIGEDAMVSVARAELFYDFLKPCPSDRPAGRATRSKSLSGHSQCPEGQQSSEFPERPT
jgi:hypothetical protein